MANLKPMSSHPQFSKGAALLHLLDWAGLFFSGCPYSATQTPQLPIIYCVRCISRTFESTR